MTIDLNTLLSTASAIAVLWGGWKVIKEIKEAIEKPLKDQQTKMDDLETRHVESEKIIRAEIDKYKKEINDRINKERAELENQIQELSEKHNKEIVALNAGIACLLRDRINSYYYKRAIEAQAISAEDLAIAEQLYESYHALGGNGVITQEMEKMRKLLK